MIISKQMCKAARALSDWTAVDLAKQSGVSHDTIRSFESGRTATLNARNQEAVRAAFGAAGIQFLAGGEVAQGAGVARIDKGTADT